MHVAVLISLLALRGAASTPEKGDSPLSQVLRAMGEPPIGSLKAEEQAFRFFWCRAFHPPIFVQVERHELQIWLTTKMLDSPWSTPPAGTRVGHLVLDRKKLITPSRWYQLAEMREAGFWRQATEEPERGGADGAYWVLEGVSWGEHHSVIRWSPRDGPVRALGLAMVELAGIRVDPQDVY
jgi:hypothetical protein